jgi:hypothetical protein
MAAGNKALHPVTLALTNPEGNRFQLLKMTDSK